MDNDKIIRGIMIVSAIAFMIITKSLPQISYQSLILYTNILLLFNVLLVTFLQKPNIRFLRLLLVLMLLGLVFLLVTVNTVRV